MLAERKWIIGSDSIIEVNDKKRYQNVNNLRIIQP